MSQVKVSVAAALRGMIGELVERGVEYRDMEYVCGLDPEDAFEARYVEDKLASYNEALEVVETWTDEHAEHMCIRVLRTRNWVCPLCNLECELDLLVLGKVALPRIGGDSKYGYEAYHTGCMDIADQFPSMGAAS